MCRTEPSAHDHGEKDENPHRNTSLYTQSIRNLWKRDGKWFHLMSSVMGAVTPGALVRRKGWETFVQSPWQEERAVSAHIHVCAIPTDLTSGSICNLRAIPMLNKGGKMVLLYAKRSFVKKYSYCTIKSVYKAI